MKSINWSSDISSARSIYTPVSVVNDTLKVKDAEVKAAEPVTYKISLVRWLPACSRFSAKSRNVSRFQKAISPWNPFAYVFPTVLVALSCIIIRHASPKTFGELKIINGPIILFSSNGQFRCCKVATVKNKKYDIVPTYCCSRLLCARSYLHCAVCTRTSCNSFVRTEHDVFHIFQKLRLLQLRRTQC